MEGGSFVISDLYTLSSSFICMPILKVFEHRRVASNMHLFLVACCVSVCKLHGSLLIS